MNTIDGFVGSIVVDRTGLAGRYEIHLRWARRPNPLEPYNEPDIASALREQLGLKLVKTKAVLTVLVVDRYEKTPTAN